MGRQDQRSGPECVLRREDRLRQMIHSWREKEQAGKGLNQKLHGKLQKLTTSKFLSRLEIFTFKGKLGLSWGYAELIELNANNSTTKGNICENNTFFHNVAIANVCRANLPADHL